MVNALSAEMKAKAVLSLMKNTVKRVQEARALDTTANALQLTVDQALYLIEESGIAAVVALVNPTEKPEQVIGATIEIASSDGDRFEFLATSVPPTIHVPEVPAWGSAFPVRIAAIEALIGQMYFIADDERRMIQCARAIGLDGPLRAAIHFMTLKSGTLVGECRLSDARHYRSIG
jgi:hypothetical protein